MLDELLDLGAAPARARPRTPTARPKPQLESRHLATVGRGGLAAQMLGIEPGAPREDPLAPAPGQAELFADLAPRTTLGSLQERFGVPPFSVLDARAGYWGRRKAEWLALGIQSELGRGDGILWGSENLVNGNPRQVRDHSHYAKLRQRQKAEQVAGQVAATSRRAADLRSNLTGAAPLPEWANNGYANVAPGTSIFDPVLCELAYCWFTPGPDSSILDPFAGGSVRGIVAAILGHRYTGIDLSESQVEANDEQAATILPDRRPYWIVGDSRELEALLGDPDVDPDARFDLLFSCPPYYDLEVYSDDPADLSTAPTYAAFLEGYGEIIRAALGRLRDDRFAVWVVGELRDKAGMQVGLVADTIRLFREAGASLYNEAVYLQQPGTLPLRVRRQMDVARKLGRAHQSFLVFWKGRKGPRWSPISTSPAEEDVS